MTPALFDLVSRHLIFDEGYKLKPYKCPAGFWTVGVGHNLDARGETPRVITRDEAMQLLEEDVAVAEADAIKWLGATRYAKYSNLRKAGFTNFSFNLGYNAMFKFKYTREAIVIGEWDEVANKMRASKWAAQVKSRSERVINLICFERETYT